MRIGKIIAISIILIGLISIMIGVTADYIFGGNPGIGSGQIIIITISTILIVSGIGTLSEGSRHIIRQNLGRILLISLPSILLMLIGLELALNIIDFEPYYPVDSSTDYMQRAPWFMCDDIGCRYDYEARMAACEGQPLDRSCVINPQGFQDTDTFGASSELDNASVRILALGDSFTFGASADLGHSYVETIETEIPASIVWNTGIIATGTGQALAILKTYAPVMQPDIVTLGFYFNDYEDNGFPLDPYFWSVRPDGTVRRIIQYNLDSEGNATRVTDMQDLFYHAYEVHEPSNNVVYFIGRTGIGSLLFNARDALQNTQERQSKWEREVNATRTYLTEIRDFTAAHNIKLIILLIPQRADLVRHTETYDSSLSLFDELDLTVVNPINFLTDTHYATLPDAHWNNEGHTLVGQLLAACIRQLEWGEENIECGNALTPATSQNE